jgi:hypothetical protein
MKQIPLFGSDLTEDKSGNFSGSDVTGKAQKLVKDLGLTKADYVANAVDPMLSGGFTGSLATLLADGRLCYTGSVVNPADVAKIQEATTLIHDDTTPIPESTLGAYGVRNLVVVGAN